MATPASIGNFVSEIVKTRGGPANPTLYQFEITPPGGAEAGFKSHVERFGFSFDKEIRFLNYLNNEIQIPGVTFQNSEVRMPYKGLALKMASAKVYNEMDISFYCDTTAMPYKFFRAWLDWVGGTQQFPAFSEKASLVRHGTSCLRYYNEYTCDMVIRKLEKYGPKKKGEYASPFAVRLVNAWPFTVSSVPLSSASANGLVKVTVSLYYELSVAFNK